jgi:hypothetical protein
VEDRQREMMHVYKGFPQRTDQGGYLVTKDGQPLDLGPSQKLDNHSPDGFMWGYSGSGLAQLALALLLDVTEDPELAMRYHQEFKEEMIAGLAIDEPWVMVEITIKSWVREKQILARLNNG